MANNKLVNKAADALEQMKWEIAQEFGVELGADQIARINGSVGGEMVKRLVQYAEQSMLGLDMNRFDGYNKVQ